MILEKRDRIFNNVSENLSVMAKVVFKQMQYVKDCLAGVAAVEVNEFNNNETIIDSIEVRLKGEVVNAIVLYGPRTGDLRKLMACYDVSTSLERIGDHLLNIFEYLRKSDLDGQIYTAMHDKVQKFLDVAEEMSKNALIAFTCGDTELARSTIDLDDKADMLFADIVDAVAVFPTIKTLDVKESMDVLAINSIAYNIERISDSASNIAESTVYLMEGKNIMHAENKNQQ